MRWRWRCGPALKRVTTRPEWCTTATPEPSTPRSATPSACSTPVRWPRSARSAIGTLVERATRYTILLPLPRMDGYGAQDRVKNGPALAGHGAEAVKNATIEAVAFLPEKLRQTLTWDRGTEMAAHTEITRQTGLAIFFCDPHSPWQRGTNENTNGLLRQYFPKGTDLSRYNPEQLAAVAHTLNTRPRKVLDWKTPAEVLQRVLYSRP